MIPSRPRQADAALITVTLDPPTLLLALLLGFLLLALELGLAQRTLRHQVELRIWAQGTWLLLLGFAAFGLRPWLSGAFAVFLSNALLLAGMVTYTRALHQFLLDAALPRWVWALFAVALAVLAVVLPAPLHLRTSLVSLVYVAVLLPSVVLILRRGWFAERSLRTVAFTMSLACMALVVRAVHAWIHPDQYGALLQASLGQGLTFLVCFLSVLGAGFGFVLSSFQRVASRMEAAATHDGLTGCVNRSAMEALIEHALQRGRREASPVALVLLDLDHFKDVNDHYGHRAGDQVLRAFAEAVRSRLRKSDVFGRVGGEEFALLLPDTDGDGAARLAEEVRRVVQDLRIAGGAAQPMRITLSGGIAVATAARPLAAEQLYALADESLYRAKRGGRNRVERSPTAPAEALAA